MDNTAKVGDIMTRNVLTVRPDDSLQKIAELFEQHNYDGLPVVDELGKLQGIITEYDMVAQSSGMHLPTIINIVQSIGVDKSDKGRLDEQFDKLKMIKAREIMNKEPLTIEATVDIGQAARLFAEHHKVNPLCVVGAEGVLVGVLSHYDVIRFFNKQFVRQVIRTGAGHPSKPNLAAITGGNKALKAAVDSVYREVLLVSSYRPLIWRGVALAAFLAGVVTATVFIFDVVISRR